MPIDQNQINLLLDSSVLSTQSNRVFMVERGNMMTAMSWFTKITGQRLAMADLTRLKAAGGFFIHTYAGNVNGNPVNVNLRGGSSSSITSEKHVMLLTKDYQMLGEIHSTSTTPGCPTIDITNPQHLGGVPRVVTLDGRIEIKFATTYTYVQ
ncbi:hypothetical protein [Telluria beijingensis]|uniref:hypothetical protein n=1 Tax=Telluria beijingensis TaxID=3068633 RepID=UPI002795DA9B|nr:hypothetical protein [Massilia sp. REN29]